MIGAEVPPTAASHALTQSERELILATANRPEYRNFSPRQIVPLLADRGEYIASESSFHRVLREAGQLAHRQHARPVRRHRPKEHVARGPNEVWSWDITYLRGPVRGTFLYLYLIVDVWSRKIVGRNLRYEESAEHTLDPIEQAIADEDVDSGKLVLHADNGGPMKGSTLVATLQRLGVVPSFSRPSVSDDNPFSEALFRTMKYRPDYPRKPFANFADALQWVESFVSWYNNEHLHSGIRYVTPADRHSRKERPILSKRHARGSATNATSLAGLHSQLVPRRRRAPKPHQAGGARLPNCVAHAVTTFSDNYLDSHRLDGAGTYARQRWCANCKAGPFRRKARSPPVQRILHPTTSMYSARASSTAASWPCPAPSARCRL